MHRSFIPGLAAALVAGTAACERDAEAEAARIAEQRETVAEEMRKLHEQVQEYRRENGRMPPGQARWHEEMHGRMQQYMQDMMGDAPAGGMRGGIRHPLRADSARGLHGGRHGPMPGAAPAPPAPPAGSAAPTAPPGDTVQPRR